MHPPAFEEMLDWVEGRLPAEEAAAIADFVERADEETQDTVRWLRAFRRVSSETVLAPLPSHVRSALAGRFVEHAQHREDVGLWQHVVAVLTFDSSARPELGGVRSTRADNVRQLVYSTDAFDVALNVQPRLHEQQIDLLGQILPNDDTAPDEFAVQLLQVEMEQHVRELSLMMADDLGEFAFESLLPGRYQVVLSGDALDIELPLLSLA